jgi:hypothetical protein
MVDLDLTPYVADILVSSGHPWNKLRNPRTDKAGGKAEGPIALKYNCRDSSEIFIEKAPPSISQRILLLSSVI